MEGSIGKGRYKRDDDAGAYIPTPEEIARECKKLREERPAKYAAWRTIQPGIREYTSQDLGIPLVELGD